MAADNSEPRVGPRSHVYLMAALTCGGVSMAVRVRNLSLEGALLEGPELPSDGKRVLLRRGSLSADAEIAWRRESQCGIRFNEPIRVADWVQRSGPPGQQKIDQAIAEYRGMAIGAKRLVSFSAAATEVATASTIDDLLRACERIAALPNMSLELADELMKIESLARSIAH